MASALTSCQGCGKPGFKFERYVTTDGYTKTRMVDAVTGETHNCPEYKAMKAAEKQGQVVSAGYASAIMPDTTISTVTPATMVEMNQKLNKVMSNSDNAVATAVSTASAQGQLQARFDDLQGRFNTLMEDFLALDKAWSDKLNAKMLIEVKYDDGKVVNVGRQHKLFPKLLRMVQATEAGMICTMVGEPGSGKTNVVEALAKALDVPNHAFYVISLTNQTSLSQLMGFLNGSGEYVDSPIYKVVKHGGVLLIDEFEAGNPNSWMAFQMAATNRFVGFPNGETVFKHPKCYIIAAGNTTGAGGDDRYPARNQLDMASRTRLAIIQWDTDWDLVFDIVADFGGDVVWAKKVRAINRILETKKIKFIFSARAAITGAKWLLNGFTEDEVLESFLWQHISVAERAQVEASMKPNVTQTEDAGWKVGA